MSNPERLKRWVEFSKNPKLVHSNKPHRDVIDYCAKLQAENEALREICCDTLVNECGGTYEEALEYIEEKLDDLLGN